MSMEEDIGYIKGTLEGMDHTFANIENHMRDVHEQNVRNATDFSAHDTQILDIKDDVKETKEDVKEAKAGVTKNKESIDKLKKNGKNRSIGRLAFWSAIIVASISAIGLIISRMV